MESRVNAEPDQRLTATALRAESNELRERLEECGKHNAELVRTALTQIDAIRRQSIVQTNTRLEAQRIYFEAIFDQLRQQNIDYRATVRDALLALRAEMIPGLFWTGGTHRRAMEIFDATLAKLGLSAAEGEKEKL